MFTMAKPRTSRFFEEISVLIFIFLASHNWNLEVEAEIAKLDDDVLGQISNNSKIPLYLAGFFSFGTEFDTSGTLPAIDLALDHINSDPEILDEYELKMIWKDTQCDSKSASIGLLDMVDSSEPQKTLIIGPGCSTSTQAVAEVADYWNLVTMSYTASSPALSNREKYPLFYRTYPSESSFNPALLQLLKRFNWTRVATIHEHHDLFSLAMEDLVKLLKKENIQIITSESFSEDPRTQVRNMKEKDARIIIGNMYEDSARKVFCEAYKQNMTGEGYAWLMTGWYRDGWYLEEQFEEDALLNCDREELKAAVEGSLYIATESLNLRPDNDEIVSGRTKEDVIAEYNVRFHHEDYSNLMLVRNKEWSYGYDAAWALALMLNRSIAELGRGETATRLEDFDYQNKEMAQLFFDLLNETKFEGLTGQVTFHSGDRVVDMQIQQLQPGCRGDDQHLVRSSWCVTFNDMEVDWETAGHSCMEDIQTKLVPMTDEAIQELRSLYYKTGANRTGNRRWYMGFQHHAEQHNGDNEDVGMSTSSKCTVIDFEMDGVLVEDDCNSNYPYICAQPAEYFEHQVGLYDPVEDSLELHTDFIWPGSGKAPCDGTHNTTRIYVGIKLPSYVVMATLAAICTVMASFFLAFNLRYHDQKFIRLSSPKLNNFIILGCTMSYIWIFFLGLDLNTVSWTSLNFICKFRRWIISLGSVTAFGAMFSKTWRVYQVAVFKIPKRRIIRDQHLYAVVFVLVAIDALILLTWQIIDPVYLREKTVNTLVDASTESEQELYIVYCHADHSSFGLGLVFCYKGLLLLFGTFLAFQTRKVTISALNDSKLICICVYNVSILTAAGTAVSFALGSDPNTLFLFLSGIVLLCTSITLGVVFVPKVITVYKDPTGEKATTRKRHPSTSVHDHTSSNHSTTPSSAASETNQKLQDKISQLEGKLKQEEARTSMAEYTGPSSCGLWCFGRSCGCSSIRGCSTGKYSFGNTNGTAAAVNSDVFYDSSTSGVHLAEQNGGCRDPENTLGRSTYVDRRPVSNFLANGNTDFTTDVPEEPHCSDMA